MNSINDPLSHDGTLYYVMGASGVGKDSLLGFVRRHCQDASLMFAPRYITRPFDAGGEAHIAVTMAAFERLQTSGAFALNWSANGLHYGVGVEIKHWLAAGLKVILNGSRAHLPEACKRFEKLQPILIEVSPEKLSERLRGRGREREDEILARLSRSDRLPPIEHPALRMIRNDGELEQAGSTLLSLIVGSESLPADA